MTDDLVFNIRLDILEGEWLIKYKLFKSKNSYFEKLMLTAAMLLMTLMLFAQGDGSAGIEEAMQMVTSYFGPATQFIYAIGAVVGLIGCVKVYNKFSNGDHDTSKTAAGWFGVCILLIVAATLQSFFL